MKIEKIKLQNFRCFGHEVVELNFEEELGDAANLLI